MYSMFVVIGYVVIYSTAILYSFLIKTDFDFCLVPHLAETSLTFHVRTGNLQVSLIV